MKKFILKSVFFIAPFLLLYLLNIIYYYPNEGDLSRIGYLYSKKETTEDAFKDLHIEKKYTTFSELNLNTKNNFDVLTIGDSFSEQEAKGYNNFLANNFSVLHMDRFLSENPIQKLIELINGDFFHMNQFKYVILQSAERLFVQRTENIELSKITDIQTLKYSIANRTNSFSKLSPSFFSDATLKIPITNLQYLIYDKPTFSKTYNVKTNGNNLFTGNKDNLLFFEDDLKFLVHKNDSSRISKSNVLMNRISQLLEEKNIKLLLLISPDKYDLYYPYIKNKDKFKAPLFFNYYTDLSKDYLYINSIEILRNELNVNKNVYYFNSTHWSPIGAKAISLEINSILMN
ncbi:alginate O-acetyltransferase AlgX-related protein [Winogradskyella arenosi]|uniref:Acetyltransferase AlgX (SGNH hydrolase-like protein) n=1 Tax=Winogradskyella arenosi TaxID=533325 RepID=A0A368ZE30_9FLAO|nr:hypothetical protein [Winogradskyella arenosi]RCW91502.1 acetyltransferase AlgX (SGNH hydrolase-like protein) [Winogradskyella arenosi]